MTVRFKEGELLLEFPSGAIVEQLDLQSVPIPKGMALVDFVVEQSAHTLLIEIKDPSHSRAPEEERRRFSQKMQKDTLIHEELVPKARDSYTFLHLMERDTRRFLFVVLLGLEVLDEALLVGFKERLLARIRREVSEPWRRHYVSDCVVVTLDTWPDYFPDYPVSRTIP